MDERMLIECVQEYNHLYNPYNKLYRNHPARIKSWDEVGRRLGFTGNECKEAWTKLRSAYTAALKRRIPKAGEEETTIPKWRFEDEMAFLKPTLRSKKNNWNYSAQTDSEDEHLSNPDEDEDEMKQDYNVADFLQQIIEPEASSLSPAHAPSSSQHFTPSDGKLELAKFRKRTYVESSANDVVVQTSRENSNTLLRPQMLSKKQFELYRDLDETELFFLSMSRTVSKLSPFEQTRVKMEVSKVVFEAELRELQKQNHLAEAATFSSSCKKFNSANSSSAVD